ncbi:MAG: HNH endonuclease [Bacteroidia bacterium]
MRKIEKDKSPNGVPISLRHPDIGPFANGYELRRGKTTHEKRLEMIAERKYIEKHSDRYKQKDTEAALDAIYHGKCAYCEQRVEGWQVEHYRPKSVYYWLAFSWDNLLAACPACNTNKLDKFVCECEEGVQVRVDHPPFEWAEIHDLLSKYDEIENPKLIHPEVDDLVSTMIFERDGSVRSDNVRMEYTIQTCGLDRTYLNDERRKILEDFRKDIKGEFLKVSQNEQVLLVRVALEKFKAIADDPRAEFTAFRRFMLRHWIRSEIVAAIPLS